MGSYRAGIWLVCLVAYFFLFITLINSVSSLNIDGVGNSTGFNDTSSLPSSSEEISYRCGTPRYAWSSPDNQYRVNKKTNDCETTKGAVSEKVCNNISGCEFGNTTTSYWFFSQTKEGCFGEVNISYYNNGSDEYSNICELSSIDTPEECNMFGCSYYEITTKPDTDISSHKNILSSIGDLFSFRYDFGFETDLFNNLLNFIFFYIPFIMLLLTIYYMVPLIH